MNAKTCKQLRRIARSETVGLPLRRYAKGCRGRAFQYGTDPITGLPLWAMKPDQVVLDSRCTRSAYRQLKKLVRSTSC